MSKDDRVRVKDESNDRIYFTLTPRLVWALSEDPYEYTFWSVVKDIAGEKGECILSREDLATLSMMSNGKASACRESLIRKRLLIGDFRRDPGYPQPVWHLRIPDFWEANVRWARTYLTIHSRIAYKREQAASRKASPHDASPEPSPGGEGVPLRDGGPSPDDTKKNVLKNQKEEQEVIWEQVLELLKPGMPQGGFEKYVRGTRAVRYGGNTLVVLAADVTARDWLDDRVRRSAERLLVGICAQEISLEFVTVVEPVDEVPA